VTHTGSETEAISSEVNYTSTISVTVYSDRVYTCAVTDAKSNATTETTVNVVVFGKYVPY